MAGRSSSSSLFRGRGSLFNTNCLLLHSVGCCYVVTRCPTVLENDRSFTGLQCEIRAIRTKYSLLSQICAVAGRVNIHESMSWCHDMSYFLIHFTRFVPGDL